MIRLRPSIPTPVDSRRRGAAVVVALAALALLGAAAGAATAQSDRPTVVVTDGSTTADGTTTVGVVLTSAPDGLAGYYLELTVQNPEVVSIRSASYPARFGLTSDPEIGADGTTLTLEAADVEGAVEPGATDVTLATVTVAGASPGEVELTLDPRQFDADDGSAVDPATQSGTVTVGGGGATPSTAAAGSTGTDVGGGDGTAGDADGDRRGTDPPARSTSGAGPLSPALVFVAMGTVAIIGLRRRR
ncbi:hypothetical protein [Haloplanus pelagicus]|jgi:hypothetical protein|uniref:hypothetical protein n=1 Tax=Haloplanus pelagicus TaxID=2949995 RepID=UPI00203B0C59|nr:hypothetical protein [Haloplanus sp. HW8-1]